MEALFTTDAWASPGGVGFFLVCLGGFFYLMFRLDTKKKK
jgi:hypothetical protein